MSHPEKPASTADTESDGLYPIKTWTYLIRVTVACDRPAAEQRSRPERLQANVERAGGILLRDGHARLLSNDRIQWSGDVPIERMHAPYRGETGVSPESAALDLGVSALRVALSSIWKWERQDLPGRTETKTRRLSVTEGRYR